MTRAPSRRRAPPAPAAAAELAAALALSGVMALAGCSESRRTETPFDPSSAEERLPTVAAALREGDPARALAELDRAAAAGGLPDGALYLRGLALLDADRPDEARAAFEAELTAHPGDGHAHAQLARLLIDAGRLDEAAAHLQQARELAPGFLPVLLQSGRLALRAGDDESAQRFFRDYLAHDPYGEPAVEAHTALGQIAARRGPGAAGEAQAHAETAANLRQLHDDLGRCLARLRQDPRDAEAAHGVAMAYLSLYVSVGHDPRLLAQAEQALAAALAVTPEDPRALSNLGFIRAEQRRFDEAIEIARRAIASDDRYSPAHVNLGGLLLRTGRADEALAEFERGLQTARGPDEALRARIELVRCLASRPAPADLRRALEEARPLVEQDQDGRLGVAAVLQELQRRLDAAPADGPVEPGRPAAGPNGTGGADD